MITLATGFLIILAYLLGSISAGLIVSRIMKLPDPRTIGSKNLGATNVLRSGGKKAAAITLLGDMLKGFIPIAIGHVLGLDFTALMLIGMAAFLGHLYPVYLRFKGGKGIATALGVYLGLNILGGVAVALTWLLVAKLFKISSLAGLTSTLAAPIYFYFLTQNINLTIGLAVMTVLIYWKHRSNIKNLLAGTEGRIKGHSDHVKQ